MLSHNIGYKTVIEIIRMSPFGEIKSMCSITMHVQFFTVFYSVLYVFVVFSYFNFFCKKK